MKHLRKYNESEEESQYGLMKSKEIKDNMAMQDKIVSSYQAFLFGCFLSNPNDFKIDDKGNLVDEGGIFTSDFNKWWEEGGKVPKQFQ
jgi:hypothetical protein